MLSRFAPAALAVLIGALPLALSAAQGAAVVRAPPDAEGFARDHESAAKLMRARNWKGAREAWLGLLRRHAGADYVWPKVEEIRLGLKKCAFWLVTEEPEPAALMSGDLRLFVPSSGQVEIHYGPGDLLTFEHSARKAASPPANPFVGDCFSHPIVFRGSYSLEITGTAEELKDVSFRVALEDGGGYAIDIGSHDGKRYTYHCLSSLHDGVPFVRQRVAPKAPPKNTGKDPGPPKPIKAVVKVDSSSVAFTYDGDEVLRTPNVEKTFGSFSLCAWRPFEELVVKGKIEASWIDGLQDAFVLAARAEFDEDYRDPPELEPWADARPKTTARERFTRLLAELPLPGTFSPEQSAILADVAELRAASRARHAVEVLRALPQGALPEGALTLLLALCELEGGRPARALAHLREHERLMPLSPALEFLEAHLLSEVEGEAEAIEILTRLAGAGTDEPLVHLTLTTDLVMAGRLDEARAALERGLARSSMAELVELRTLLAKATLGPEWRRSFAHASERFAVSSDIELELCRAAVRELDETWSHCRAWLGALEPPAAPCKAYLFSGEAGYAVYARDITRADLSDSLGAYSKGLDQILAWNSTDRERLFRTLRHECAHHYLDLALGAVPIWLDEGLAQYVSASKLETRRWEEGAPDPAAVSFLREYRDALTPLAMFLRLDDESFMRAAGVHYPEAWAFVHFLRRGGDPLASAFHQRLWQALAGRTDAASALEKALEGVDLAALEQRFLAYCLQLTLPAGSRR